MTTTLDPDDRRKTNDDPAERVIVVYRAAELAMRGMSYRAIAEELGTSHETVRQQLNTAEGQRVLREAREEYLARTGRMMASLGMVALQTLGQAMVNPDASLREKITAASKILDLQHRHAVVIEGIGPGQTVTVTDESDDLEWLYRRARKVREVLDVSVDDSIETPPVSLPTAVTG